MTLVRYESAGHVATITPVEKPETVLWVDPVHRDPAEKG